MTVSFSVVGIFYSTQVDLTKVKGNTVENIMTYIRATDPSFLFSEVVFQQNRIINAIAYRHRTAFTGRTGISYPPGLYQLFQSFTVPSPNPYSVWQYYLADQNGVRRPTRGDYSYTKAIVPDGWSIVWRLVTIANAPMEVAKRLRQFVPPDEPEALATS